MLSSLNRRLSERPEIAAAYAFKSALPGPGITTGAEPFVGFGQPPRHHSFFPAAGSTNEPHSHRFESLSVLRLVSGPSRIKEASADVAKIRGLATERPIVVGYYEPPVVPRRDDT